MWYQLDLMKLLYHFSHHIYSKAGNTFGLIILQAKFIHKCEIINTKQLHLCTSYLTIIQLRLVITITILLYIP